MNIPVSRYARLLSQYLRPQGRRVLLLALLVVASIAIELANPQLVKRFINTATADGSTQELFLLAGVFVAAALVGQGLTIAATWLGETVAWTATNDLRAHLFDHCLRLDMSFHKSRTPGEMIQRIDGDVDALSDFFSQLVITVLGNLLLLCGVVVLLVLEDWRIGLAMGGFAVVALVAMGRVHRYAVPHWAAEREAGAQFYGFLGEVLTGTEDVRANGAGDYVMMRFHKQARVWLRHRVLAFLSNSLMWMTSMGAFAVADAIAFALGAWLWHRGEISIGAVYVIFYYTELLRRPIEQIREQLQQLQTATASIGRIEELFATQPRLENGTASIPAGPLSLELDRVTFGYEAGEPVVEDISLRLEPGRVLGLLGRTGSGKTTLARLIFRLYDPDAGELRLGGVPVRHARLQQLRTRVGMVTQEVQIFAASIRDNLTFFDPSVPDERLLEVIEDIGLGPWFAAQPRGLDTEIAAGGLSAGEAQLLAFARLFLEDPGLVILDEASSRLDPATENLIERAVSKLLAGRTAILIAHRLSTIERADEVLILEGGRVAEAGPRAALAVDPESRFYRLLQTDLQAVPA